MHTRDRGFTNPLALCAALIVCIALGYTLVKVSSIPAPADPGARPAKIVGDLLDATLPDEEAKPAPTPVSDDVLFNSPYEEPKRVLKANSRNHNPSGRQTRHTTLRSVASASGFWLTK